MHNRPVRLFVDSQRSSSFPELQRLFSSSRPMPLCAHETYFILFGQVRAKLPAGVDGWGYSLKGMMSMVVVGGFLITLTYWALQRTVVPRVQAGQPKKKKQKSNMSIGESFNFLAKSPYIRDLATLVSALGDSYMCLCISNANLQGQPVTLQFCK